ncbi:hypothetical protein GW17_00058288 [Ensete ventricosum]|nr:hypothetical protein GW17_00058288 [Ensete ventricosum]
MQDTGAVRSSIQELRHNNGWFKGTLTSCSSLFLPVITSAPALKPIVVLVAQAIGYNFDYDDYHSFVHGRLPYNKLKPDPVLRQLLLSLPIRKVFTNGDEVHAAKVLKKLGLEDCFEGVICFETLNPPSSSCGTQTSSKIFDIVGHFSKPDTSGIELPKTPVLVKGADHALESIHNIREALPELWEKAEKSGSIRHSGKVAMETSVTA